MIVGIQIIAIIFALIMIYITYVYYKRNNYGYKSLVLWISVWLAALVLVSVPRTVYGVMEVLQIERTADFFVIAGFAFFSIIIFHLFTTVKKNTQKMEELVRKLSMEKKRKKK